MKSATLKIIVFAVAALILTSVLQPAMPVSSQQPSVGISGGVTNDTRALAGYTFNYQLLKLTVALWSDGRGDVVLERRLQNVDIANWSGTTWYFDWYPGTYSQIRAWDDAGPLNVSTSQSGTRIYVTVYFRHQIQPGENYHFYLAITIANMAYQVSGSNWRANWYTYPGSPVQEFVQGVTFPSNSVIQSASPTPTSQNFNYLEWRYTNTSANWQDTINVNYTLSNTVCGISLFLQTSSPWATDAYGNYPDTDTVNTIRKWGCYMTSAAMVIDYWGQQKQPSFHTDPRALNSWLRSHNGYDANNGVIHAAIVRYANDNGVSLYNTGYIAGRNDTKLDEYLTSGNPVIIGVNPKTDPETGRRYASHFVVATGKTTVNGTNTYSINDPWYGQTTLYNQWNNDYYSILLLTGTLADRRTLRVSAHSPVELLITDPQGRKLGYDPATGVSWNDVPEASYFISSIAANGGTGQEELPKSKVALIFNPLDGDYNLKVSGTNQGTYTINTYASDWQGTTFKQTSSGTAQPGSVDNRVVHYTSVIPQIFLPLITK